MKINLKIIFIIFLCFLGISTSLGLAYKVYDSQKKNTVSIFNLNFKDVEAIEIQSRYNLDIGKLKYPQKIVIENDLAIRKIIRLLQSAKADFISGPVAGWGCNMEIVLKRSDYKIEVIYTANKICYYRVLSSSPIRISIFNETLRIDELGPTIENLIGGGDWKMKK